MKQKLISVSLALALGLSWRPAAANRPPGRNPCRGTGYPFPALWNSSSGTPSPIRTT